MKTELSPKAATSRKPTREMNKLMDLVLSQPENQVCADCPDKKPLWVSYLSTLPNGGPKRMGVLVCANCARRHHFELGDKRCHIHYLKMVHEFSLQDVETLEQTGNAVVNRVFEGKLTKDIFDKDLVLEEEEQEDERRSSYIRRKYKKHQYKDPTLYQQLMINLLHLCAPKPQEEAPTKSREDPKPDRSAPRKRQSNSSAVLPTSDHSKEDSRSDRSSRSTRNSDSKSIALSPAHQARRKEGRRRGIAASRSPSRRSVHSPRSRESDTATDPHKHEAPRKVFLQRGSNSCSNLLDGSFGDYPSHGYERSSSSKSLHSISSSSRVGPPPTSHSGTEKRDVHAQSDHSRDSSQRKPPRRADRGATNSHHRRSSISPKPTSSRATQDSRSKNPQQQSLREGSRMVRMPLKRSGSCPNLLLGEDEQISRETTFEPPTGPFFVAKEGTTAKEPDRIPNRRTTLKASHSDSKLMGEDKDEAGNPPSTPRMLSRRQLMSRASSTSNLMAARKVAVEQANAPDEPPKRPLSRVSSRTSPVPKPAPTTTRPDPLLRLRMKRLPSSSPNMLLSSAGASNTTSNRNAEWTTKEQPSRSSAMPYVRKTVRSIANLDGEEASSGNVGSDGSARGGRRTLSGSGLLRMRATLAEHRSNSRRSLGARSASAKSLIG
jgi:Putative GTPase activating protein for Arf